MERPASRLFSGRHALQGLLFCCWPIRIKRRRHHPLVRNRPLHSVWWRMPPGWGARRRCADVPIDSAAAASCCPGVRVAGDSRRCAVGVASRSAAVASCFPGVWVAGDSRRCAVGVASCSAAVASCCPGVRVAGDSRRCAEGVASRFQGARVVGDSMRFPGE